jgi:hypothetical protein
MPRPKYKPIIEQTAVKSEHVTATFDPTKHLAFKEAVEVVMMEDLGYAKDAGVSPVAVSQPFRLFSKEAIGQMRAEILKPEVMKNCAFRSNIAACQLRGYAKKYPHFLMQPWHYILTICTTDSLHSLMMHGPVQKLSL